jgi:hypothetical protein
MFGRCFDSSSNDVCFDDWRVIPITIGVMVFHGDTDIQQGSRVLDHGQNWQGLRFACQSDQKGSTCSNDQKHGFRIENGSKDILSERDAKLSANIEKQKKGTSLDCLAIETRECEIP